MTIVFAQQEPSEIGGNCLTIAMVNPAAPGGKSDVLRLWAPNRHAKIKSPRHLNSTVIIFNLHPNILKQITAVQFHHIN